MRNFTDWWIVVRRSDEPVHRYWHFLNGPEARELEKTGFPYRGVTYAFNTARAYTLKNWRPWRLWGQFKIHKIPHYLNEYTRGKRIGMLVYNEPDINDIVGGLWNGKQVQPIHIAKIAPPDPEKNPVSSKITPRILSSIVNFSVYGSTWRSIKFGVVGVIKSRWILIVAAAIIGIVLLLYFLGYIPIGRGR